MVTPLDVGGLVEGLNGATLSVSYLRRPDVGVELRRAWLEYGVLVMPGLTTMTEDDLVAISGHFGNLGPVGAGREHATLYNGQILRIGNVRDENGQMISVPSSARSGENMLPADGNCQYRPADHLPAWHTDGTFLHVAPAGSAFFARRAPPRGAETCFADMRRAFHALSPEEREYLDGLECVCSLAHHDSKIRLRVPEYPQMSSAERALNPAVRVPLVLTHPATRTRSLYGMNSSTCKIVPKGTPVDLRELEVYELEGVEHGSVSIWRKLLPRVTERKFTMAWKWREGDLVVWDNRSTLHCGTGYLHDRHVREMWRTTILPTAA